MGMLKEFQEFAVKGNVVDMGVGIVIGAAFTSIVNSLVADIINPILGVITGGVDFSNFFVNLGLGRLREPDRRAGGRRTDDELRPVRQCGDQLSHRRLDPVLHHPRREPSAADGRGGAGLDRRRPTPRRM